MRKKFRGQAGTPVPSSRLSRAQRGATAMGMMAFTGRRPKMTQRDFRAGTAMGMMAATGGRFRNQIGSSVPTCPFIGELFWDISGGQGVVHPVYIAWSEQRIANGQDAEVISWAQETGCYPALGNPASDQNIVVAQWSGQNDYIAPNDIQQALAIYEGSGVSGNTSDVTSGKKPLFSKRPRGSKMKGVTGRDDCGFMRQSGYSLELGTGFDSSSDLLTALAQQDPYTSAYQSDGVSGLLDFLADPNDISSGEFGGVDSLLDDLAGGSSNPMSALTSGDGFTPVISGGGGGMPPPPPIISGGGGGMPPPPPIISGGGGGMPPPPPIISGGGGGMPPPLEPRRKPIRRPKTSRVARTLSGLM